MRGSDQPPARLWAYDYDFSTEAMQWVEIRLPTSLLSSCGAARSGATDSATARASPIAVVPDRETASITYTEAAMQAERKTTNTS